MNNRTLVIELDASPATGTVRLTLSIPGREGTVRVDTKGAASGTLTVPQAESIQASVAQAVWDFLVTLGGAQELLPGF